MSRMPQTATSLNAVPYSAEAESATIGCMMAQPHEVIDIVCETLVTEDFFVPAHREIFEVLREMHNQQRAIDAMTIHQMLVDRKLADQVGSPGILGELLVSFATHLHINSYVRTVKNKSLLRHLEWAATAIVEDAREHSDCPIEVLDRAEAAISKITQAVTAVPESNPGEVMDSELKRIINYDGRRPIQGISSGFYKLDELTGGWHPGEMIVLAARPGIGKTALAGDFMHAAARNKFNEKADAWVAPGHSVGMISIEMPETQIELRRLSKKSGISLQKLRVGLTDERDRQLLRMAREEMRNWPIVIRDPSALTITQARSMARKMKKKFGIELLVIDYLQLLTSPSSNSDNRQNEVAMISRGVKALAKELSIPVIILAQLNRKSEESNKPPALHNLRESGAIEQDADVVLLLHRPEAAKDTQGNEIISPITRYSLNIAKQRNGPTDDLEILFNAPYARFEDPIRKHSGQ